MIPILILAAGQSSRMEGRDKLLEDVDGIPLLCRQVVMAQTTGHPVYVALARDGDKRQEALVGLGADALFVPDASEGISGTMRGAVAQLPEAPAFMITLADLVALTTADLLAVLQARTKKPDHLIWRGATVDGKPGHPILFDASLRDAFADLSGDQGGSAVTKPHASQTCLVPFPDQRARFDLDTPAEWAAWRKSRL